MATEAPVNIAPPECSPVGSTATDSFPWQPDSLNMHVTRPKSAKGRTRPRLHKRLGMEGCSGRAPASLPPAIPCESPSSHKPGACTPGSPDQGAPGEIPELLQQAPFGVSSSLNKYPVLPSINRRTLEEGALETVAKKAGSLQLSSAQALSQEEACTRMSLFRSLITDSQPLLLKLPDLFPRIFPAINHQLNGFWGSRPK